MVNVRLYMFKNNITEAEYDTAMSVLMNGPKAQRPTWRAVKKTIARYRRGEKPTLDKPLSPWRQAKAIVYADTSDPLDAPVDAPQEHENAL